MLTFISQPLLITPDLPYSRPKGLPDRIRVTWYFEIDRAQNNLACVWPQTLGDIFFWTEATILGQHRGS